MTHINFIHNRDEPHGVCQHLSPLVRRVLCHNPSAFTYTGTGSFIIGHGTVAVIDPGPIDENHLAALLAALEPAENISHILATHTHIDHSPLAGPLKEKTAARICGAIIEDISGRASPDGTITAIETEGSIDKDFRPDIILTDGDIISGPGWTLETIATPGHISNHLCFALHEEQTLFTGDHIMGWASSVVAPPYGNMKDYMQSLEKIGKRQDKILRPTHGPAIPQPQDFIAAYLAHRRHRHEQIHQQLATGCGYIRDIVAALYTDIDPRLKAAASLSVFSHLQAMIEDGIAVTDGTPQLEGYFRLADAPVS